MRTRYRAFILHPAFQRRPAQVLARWFMWEIFKAIRYDPIINIHEDSQMQLKVGPKRGVHGLVYIYRDAVEQGVRYVIDQFASPGTICYDIGANIGLWTLRMSETVSNSGRIYAFEPMSTNLGMLKHNIELSEKTNVEVVPVGLGANQRRAKLYVPMDPGSASLAPETPYDRIEEISIQRLDDIWKDQGCPCVAYVKIDVEGSEPLVLEGGAAFFNEAHPVVSCEVNSRKLSPLGKRPDDIFEEFRDWGYESTVWDSTTQSLAKLNSGQHSDAVNAVFIPRSS